MAHTEIVERTGSGPTRSGLTRQPGSWVHVMIDSHARAVRRRTRRLGVEAIFEEEVAAALRRESAMGPRWVSNAACWGLGMPASRFQDCGFGLDGFRS